MRLNISGRNMAVSDALKERIEKKTGKLDRYLEDHEEVQVRLSQERGGRNTAEITISLGGVILRAEETSADMYGSIDKALDKIVRQIRRHRTRLEKQLRVGAFEVDPETDSEPEERAGLVRTKRFAVKPMTVEDAIEQMDMLGHSFFLFTNAETETACVVYKRQDGNYGLLETE